MAQSKTSRRNGHARQRSATARAKAAAKKPRRGAAEAKAKTKRAATTASRKAPATGKLATAAKLGAAGVRQVGRRSADRVRHIASRAGESFEQAKASLAE